MRIAFFTESLQPLVDGVSLTLGHLFDTLEAEGVDFRVFSPFVPDRSTPWAGRVRRIRSFAFPLYRAYRVSLPLGHGLASELDDFEPDLIHAASPTPMAVWAQRYAATRGLPFAGAFHTNFVAYFRYYRLSPFETLGWRYLRWFYGRCTTTLVPSRTMARQLASRGFRDLHLWSRGVDAALFSPSRRDDALRARLGADENAPLVLMVSRLVKEKDLADLAPMARLLRERGRSFRLALVGDGPMRGALERALSEACFAGHRTGEDLARWYASADVFVFPSTTETFGNVVLEAQASGVPAVVVDRGGPPGVISPGITGLVARANDPAALADRVEALLQDRKRRVEMARAASTRARTRDWDAVNRRLLEHYRRIARAPHRRAQRRRPA